MNFSNKTVCLLDCSLFTGFAEHLVRDGWGKVIYLNRWQSSYAYSSVHDVGEGLDGVRVYDGLPSTIEKDRKKWRDPDAYDENGLLREPSVDLFICMDLGYADETDHLRALGYRVFGAGQAEKLESDRAFAKALFTDSGLDYMDETYEIVKGAELRAYVRAHPKQTLYIKGTSKVRGDMESRRVGCPADLDDWLRSDMVPYLGTKFDSYPFVVENCIDDIVEAAFDVWTVDGQFPTSGLVGVEQKDAGYGGKFCTKIPEQFTSVNALIAPYLKRHKARSFMSIETLIDAKGLPYPTDPAMRGGLPCHGSEQMIYKNLSEIMYEGAIGNLIEPIPNAMYAAECVITSDSHKEQSISVPDSLAPHVRIIRDKKTNGLYRWLPQPLLKPPEGNVCIGTVVGTGSSLKKAADMALDIAEEICGSRTNLEYDRHALSDISDSFEKLEERIGKLA